MSFRIFIYCDDPSHAPRRVAVTNYVALPGGGWHEEPASRATTGHVGAGYHLVADRPAETGWALDPEVSNNDVRSKHGLVCRKCKGRPVPVNEPRLFPVLDGWRELGESEVPLASIAASLMRKPRAD